MIFVGDSDADLDEIEEFLTGARHSRETDRVLATVLFTDIVGSTKRAAQLGDRDWRELLDAHDRVVRRQLERFRGREVNTAGDGFLATFDGPGRAIVCACAIRDAVRALGIEVRAGLHTGEVEVRGNDIAGMAVHIGARVAAIAEAGEVLVSGAVPPLVTGSGIQFAERGEHELKGVPERWHLFAVEVVTDLARTIRAQGMLSVSGNIGERWDGRQCLALSCA
jgi:class 3 adenylate cyclase